MHVVIKRQIFTFIFVVFLPHSSVEIQILPFLTINGRYVRILLPVSILALILSAPCDFASV